MQPANIWKNRSIVFGGFFWARQEKYCTDSINYTFQFPTLLALTFMFFHTGNTNSNTKK